MSLNEKYNMLNTSTMDGKYVIVNERNELSRKTVVNSTDYVLEGIFAFFGRENENGRIYEEEEYMPHMEYLLDKIKKNTLLGELDHPKEFDISLSNVSHIVEDIWVDKGNRVLRGRIKVLDTPKGETLKRLIDSGVCVSISSRAAGLVESNKKVKIKKIFTYDVVCDGGFGDEAMLNRVYESLSFSPIISKYTNISESLGINNSNITVFDLGEDEAKLKKVLEKTSTKEMSYIKESDFIQYSEMMKNQIILLTEKVNKIESIKSKNISESLDSNGIAEYKEEINALKSQIKEITDYNLHLFENLSAVKKLAEDNDEYQVHLFENLTHTKSEISQVSKYANHLYENLAFTNEYTNHLFENISETKSEIEVNNKYFDHIHENLLKTQGDVKINEAYSTHLFENLKSAKVDISLNEKYSEHLFENLKATKTDVEINEKYAEHLYEAANFLIKESKVNENYLTYLKEHLENNINLTDGLVTTVNESKSTTPTTKPVVTLNESSNFDDKINQLIDAAKNKKVVETIEVNNYQFFKKIDENKQREFLSLDETKKQKVLVALNEKAWITSSDVISIWNEALVEHIDESKKWLTEMPVFYKETWESLSESKRNDIIKQSMNHKLQTEYQIKWFWDTRNLDGEIGFTALNESASPLHSTPANPTLGYNAEYIASISNQIGQSFGK